ncbi:MAG TPA: 50S ribosomal protein L11 methyltransferase [Kineosporiaceae bacterium]|nr:50S ribosomal protein L11 methyltransferase [Kineosporiaceae bacterium]
MDAQTFVRTHTRLAPAPHLPELRLWLGEDIVGLWELTEERAGHAGLPPPFWAFAWAGGTGLARYLLDNPAGIIGRRVLDVATGSGVVAVAAALAGATEVFANDVDQLALAATRLNAAANHVPLRLWPGDLLTTDGPGLPPGTDLILAGDVFYDRDLAQRMLAFLQSAADAGVRVLLGDPGRRYLPRNLLLPLDRHDVPVPRDLESTDLVTVTVWSLPARGEAGA